MDTNAGTFSGGGKLTARGARALTTWLGALCVALPGLVLAGGTATIESNTPQGSVRMDLGWADENLRLGLPGQEDGYMLVQGEKAYSVGSHGGRTMVLDMATMRQMGQGAANAAGADAAPGASGSLDRLESTGEEETVAGIGGEVYTVVWTDGNGETQEDELVLSGDPLARSLTEALGRSSRALAGRGDDLFGQALAERDMGVLRFSDHFKVVAISGDAPAGSTFELPAEPMTIQDMMRHGRQ